jgi:hypothetical protein
MKGEKINEKLADSIQAKKDSSLQAVIKEADECGLSVLELLNAIKKLPKGNLSDATLSSKLGLNADGKKKKKAPKAVKKDEIEEADAEEADAKKKKKASKAVKKDDEECCDCKGKEKSEKKSEKKSDQKGVKLVVPKSVTCPDEDDKGNEVVLVVGKDGLFGCGVLNPED